MNILKIDDIIKATNGKIIYGNGNSPVFAGISIDSRTIKSNELFIALKGLNFNGHDFLYKALETASGAIVSIPPAEPVKGKTIIYVNNTLKALQDIAHYIRINKGVPVVGITGTNGKTTTKELIASVLGTRYKVLKNAGNLNNHIGLPLSLTNLTDEYGVVVLEMGASMIGDIKELCRIAEPDYGVITNIGEAHLEGFESLENIRNTKLEILKTVKGIAVNADDSFLMEGIYKADYKGRITTYGIEDNADIHAKDIVVNERYSSFYLSVEGSKYTEVKLNVPGEFNIYNALAAAAIGDMFNLPPYLIKEGIESFTGLPMRLEIKDIFGATVISDVYNANPLSMEKALKELSRMKKKRTIAVLGDMLELGAYAEDAHRKTGELMCELPIDIFIAVGPLMSVAGSAFARSGRQTIMVSGSQEAAEALRNILNPGDTVLIKGSRGMKMERVLVNKGEEDAL
ncbi:MAG: UDP-N-acetylmuramoyl-tripeptide--D-alanyl-D-alanine ligase [Nitrospiraceae bacterium]|nr:UDP-N-acetylmuramoyl-tripeptide--D-alanyl-D-alanine ligase [Nitrospiraceae bacterium]